MTYVQILKSLAGRNRKTLAITVRYTVPELRRLLRAKESPRIVIGGLVGTGVLSFFDEDAQKTHRNARSGETITAPLVPGVNYSPERVSEAFAGLNVLAIRIVDSDDPVSLPKLVREMTAP